MQLLLFSPLFIFFIFICIQQPGITSIICMVMYNSISWSKSTHDLKFNIIHHFRNKNLHMNRIWSWSLTLACYDGSKYAKRFIGQLYAWHILECTLKMKAVSELIYYARSLKKNFKFQMLSTSIDKSKFITNSYVQTLLGKCRTSAKLNQDEFQNRRSVSSSLLDKQWKCSENAKTRKCQITITIVRKIRMTFVTL